MYERFVAESKRTHDDYGVVAARIDALLNEAYDLLGDVRGKAVLDLGCGTGENLVPLARRGAHVTGIDTNGSSPLARSE